MNIDDLIRIADPARDASPPDGSSAVARWTYAQITSGTVRAPKTHSRLRLALSGAMALALALALGEVVIGTNRSPVTTAAVTLRHAADVAAMQPTTQPAMGEYLYTETRGLYQVTIYDSKNDSKFLTPVASAQYTETEETWADAFGNGRGLLTRGALQFSSQEAQSAFNATEIGSSFSSGFDRSVEEPSLRQSTPNVSGLSTSPGELTREIADGINGTNPDLIEDGPSAVFQRAARLLVGPDLEMSSTLASALYRVLADQPSVSLLGPTTDHTGRQGVGVSTSSANGVSELIVDPQSGSALEAQFAPPPGSMLATGKGASVHCPTVKTCPSPRGNLQPLGAEEVVAPIWTDTVVQRFVSSDTATQSAANAEG